MQDVPSRETLLHVTSSYYSSKKTEILFRKTACKKVKSSLEATINSAGMLFRALDTAEPKRAALYPADVTRGPSPEDEAEFRDVSVKDSRLEWARALKAEYDDSLSALMEAYGFVAEEDLIVGACGDFSAGDELDQTDFADGIADREEEQDDLRGKEEAAESGEWSESSVGRKGREESESTELDERMQKVDLENGGANRKTADRNGVESPGKDINRSGKGVSAGRLGREQWEGCREKSTDFKRALFGRKGASGSGRKTGQARKEEVERQERASTAFSALLAHFRERVEAGPKTGARDEEGPSKRPRLYEAFVNAAACFQVTYGPAEAKGVEADRLGGMAEGERTGGSAPERVALRGFWELVARPRAAPVDPWLAYRTESQ